jgi:hypothetical protein
MFLVFFPILRATTKKAAIRLARPVPPGERVVLNGNFADWRPSLDA